mmetsp:Transcript_7783/g.13095  ORF Transcript_7783/g.13095 Transcript_7783/m.13095 type:complete len:3364 (+) Transcript_7783:26-10117(+)
MKVLLFCFALFAVFALGQFDQTRDEQSTLSLSVVENGDRHDEFSDSVLNQAVANNACRESYHDVTNVRTNNGPFNSGTYFTIEFNTATGNDDSIDFYLYDPQEDYIFDILRVVGSGSLSLGNTHGQCPPNSDCVFEYYCELYSETDSSNLEIIVSTSNNGASDVLSFYDVTFTQYVEVVSIIPSSRTFTQSTPVSDPFDGANLAPENFIQYYHELDATVAELNAEGYFFIEVTDFNDVSGTGYVCYSFETIVSTDDNLIGTTNNALLNNNPDRDASSDTITSPNGCSIECAAGTISSGSGSIYIPIPACSTLCDNTNIWIGVRPPGTDATYTVSIVTDTTTVPEVTSISAPVEIGGQVYESSNCDLSEGEFTCADYYRLTNANLNDNGYITVELYGLSNLAATIYLTPVGLGGDAECCSSSVSCSVDDETSTSDHYCSIVINSCDFEISNANDYYITVQGDNVPDDTEPSYYSFRVTTGQYTDISVDIESTGFAQFTDSVLPQQYVHYSVDFTNLDIFTSSNFIAEVYAENPVDEILSFYWNRGGLAGDGCFESMGACETFTECDYYNGVTFSYEDLKGQCRFQFLPCEYEVSEDYYLYNSFSPDSGNYHVSQLTNDIYYFSVSVVDFDDNVVPGVKYTLSFELLQPIPIFENVIQKGQVFFTEHSAQYMVHVPNDVTITTVTAELDGISNGVLRMFMQCGAPTGRCPCYTNQASCAATEFTFSFIGDLIVNGGGGCYTQLNLCEGECRNEEYIYISIVGDYPGLGYDGFIDFGLQRYAPTYFTLTTYYHQVLNPDEILPIQPSFEGTTVTGTLETIGENAFITEQHETVYENGKYSDIYQVSFENVDVSSIDSLVFNLNVLNEFYYYGDYYEDYFNIENLAGIDVFMMVTKNNLPSLTSVDSSIYEEDYELDLSFSNCDLNFCRATTGNGEYGRGFGLFFEPLSDCSIPLYTCGNDCAGNIFNPEDTYYVTIVTEYDTYIGRKIIYSLDITIFDNTPYVLTDSVPVVNAVSEFENAYYSFALNSIPSNSRLIMDLYRNVNDGSILTFYANYYDGQGDIVLPGPKSSSCKDSFFCGGCQLDSNDANRCLFNVPPCELSTQIGGTYYLAVSTSSFPDYYSYYDYLNYNQETDISFSPYDDPVYDITRTGYPYTRNYFYNSVIGHHRADYTISAQIIPMQEVSMGNPVVGSLFPTEFAYYEVNVPTSLSGSLVGRVLNIVFTTYSGDMVVGVTTTEPDETCFACMDTMSVSQMTTSVFERNQCEFESSTYYIMVFPDFSGYDINISGLYKYAFYYNDDDDCNDVENEYSIHVLISEINELNVNLQSVNSGRLENSFDSTTSLNTDENSITIGHEEYFVVSFDINANEGEFFSVTVQQNSGNTSPYTVYLSQDEFYIPPSSGDDFGLVVDTSSCTSFFDSYDATSDEEHIFIVQPCAVDQGTTTWYLTFYGPSISLKERTEIIDILIEQYTTETINVPASDVFTGVTTSLTFGDSDVDEYSYTTLSSLGLSGGEELEFQVTNADQLYVRYNGETGPGCDVSCESSDLGSTQSCSIFACDNISQDDWFIYIIGDNSASGTFTITRSAASPSDPNDITTLTLNNVQTFSSLSGSGDDYDNEFQYFQFTIPASDESRFELETNGIDSSDIYYVSSTSDVTFMPGFTASGADEYVMFSGGATDTSTCGAFQLGSLPTADCCYDTLTYVFAVVGSTGGDYDLNPTVFDHITNRDTVSLPASVSETVLEDTIDLITFNVNNGDDIYFEFSVTTGNADIYLNRGDIAGSSDGSMNEPGYCWTNDGIIGYDVCSSSVTTGNSCSATRYACLECTSSDSSSMQYTFAIAANVDTDYTLEIIALSTSTLNLGSNSENFPEDLSINDDSDFNDNFGVISQYVFTYNEDPNNEFSPLLNDDTFTDDFYPRIQFVFDNFEDASDNTPVDASELTIFIQSGSPAGSPSCLSGSDITSGRSFLPCIENGSGAADETASSITCSISVCDLSCGEQIYFGIGRSSNVETNYDFDITITEFYDDLEDNGDITRINVNPGQSSSVSFTEDTSVYFLLSYNGLQGNQYLEFELTPTGNAVVTVDTVPEFAGCLSESNFITVPGCGTVSPPDSCYFVESPCTTETEAFLNFGGAYARVERISGTGDWGLEYRSIIQTISPIDSSESRLTPISDPIYTATKVINEFDWHFYDFFVTENDGYTTLDVTVSGISCDSGSVPLEVYMSWGDANGDYSDVAYESFYPADLCFNQNGFNSYEMDICQFNAGSYRVGIFAPEGTAQFPDELDDGEIYSTRYSISAQLTTLDHVELTVDCVYSQLVNSEDFVPRFEVNIPATGPGFDLYFIVTYDHDEDDSLDSNLYLSDTYPTGNTAYCTPFGGRDDAIYTATDSDTTFMFISLDSCESIDGTYYLYIDGLEEDDDEGVLSIQVSAQIFGTQVIDLTSSASYSTDRYLSTSSGIPFGRHVYKIIVDESTPFSVNVQLAPCDDRTIWAEQDFSALEANVYIIGGGNGRFGKTLYYGDADNGICDTCGDIIYNCDLDDEDTYSCDYFNCGSTYGYYYLIIADELNDAGRTEIEYILNVNTVEQTSAISLSVGEYHNVQRGENYVFNLQNSNAEYELEVTSLSTDLTYSIYGTDLSSCFTTTCDFNVCSDFFDICDVAIPGQLYLFIDNDEYRECFDFVESVTVILRETTFDTTSISLNSPVSNSAEYGVISSSNQWLVTDANNAVSYTYYSEAASCSSGCDFVLEDSGLSGTHTYYIDTPPTGFTVSPLSIQTVSVGTSTTHTFSNNGDILNFEFSIPNDRQTSYVIYVENVSFSALDGDLETDIVFRYNLGSQPSYGCEVGGICGGSFTALTASCDSAFSPIGVSPCESNGSYYLSLALCSDITCDVDFSLRIIDVSETSSLQSGVNHASAYTSVSVTTPSACSSSSVDLVNSLAISNVDELFYVSLRNVRGGSVTVEHNHALDSCLSGDSCTAFESQFGYDCSCNLGADDCISSAMCGENNPSSTEVVFTASNPGVYYEYQIITQYVDIAPNSGSVSTTIIGETAHFYRITNSNQALSIDLTMQYGPALTMTLIAGCEYGDREFFEKRVCVAGTCSMYIATESEQPGGDSMYLALESSAVTTYDNEYYEKEASYSLSVTGGAANCVPASQAGICSEYLSDYSNSMVWNFNEGSNYISDRIDCALDYFVGEYEDRTCHRPTTECTNAIKGLLCLYFSPQCSSNGYQMNMCQDYCFEVAKQCDILPETNVIGFNCYATFFNEGTAGSCYSNSTFTSTPEEFNPRQFFEDNANPDTVAQPIPAITTTYFPPVVATMPPLILDDDDGNKKDMIHDVEQKVTEEQVGASSRDVISVSLFIFSLLISLFA